MIICFAYGWCSLWRAATTVGLFCLAARATATYPTPWFAPHLQQWRNDRMWDAIRLPTAVFMLTLRQQSISSYPLPQNTYQQEVSVVSLVWIRVWGGRCWLPSGDFWIFHFTASLNLWSSMIIIKAVKPQHLSLRFIINVCGQWKKKKKLMRGKSSHWGIPIAWVWHWPYWPSMLFSLIYFQLLFLYLFVLCFALP